MDGMTNLHYAEKSDAITMGNKISEKAIKIADINGVMCDKHGVEIAKAIMQDVTLLPAGKYNLFSLTKMMKKGWKLSGDDNAIVLTINDKTIAFDIKIPTPKGLLYAMYMKKAVTEVAGAGTDGGAKLLITEIHDKLGHVNEDMARKKAKVIGRNLTVGGMKQPCEACAAGKAKQKNAPKKSKHEEAKEYNERIYLDIATVKRQDNENDKDMKITGAN